MCEICNGFNDKACYLGKTMLKKIDLRKISLTVLLLFSISQTSFAENTDENEGVWKSNVEFGYVSTSGNTETTSVNGGFSISYEEEHWRHAVDIKTIFGSAEDSVTSEVETNAEKYFIEGKTDYKYSKESYAFVLANFENDRFSDNDYQTSFSAGRGHDFLLSETSSLKLEVGVGYRETKKKSDLNLVENSIGETIFRIAGNYSWDITKTSKFEQKISSDIGDDNTVTKSYTGLSANVAENLALKLSITATHQSDVSVETEKLDTITAFTLVYNF